ncbi:hypothetical protein ACIPYT_15920, partial [Microbacterium sp. NPDC089695]
MNKLIRNVFGVAVVAAFVAGGNAAVAATELPEHFTTGNGASDTEAESTPVTTTAAAGVRVVGQLVLSDKVELLAKLLSPEVERVTVDITYPANGHEAPPHPAFGGTGDPGATVTLTDEFDRFVCSDVVADDGTWSCVSSVMFGEGLHPVTAEQVDVDGAITEDSVVIRILADTSVNAAASASADSQSNAAAQAAAMADASTAAQAAATVAASADASADVSTDADAAASAAAQAAAMADARSDTAADASAAMDADAASAAQAAAVADASADADAASAAGSTADADAASAAGSTADADAASAAGSTADADAASA